MGIAGARVKRLAKIIETTQAKIVLVSSWKRHYERQDQVGKYLGNKLRKENLAIYDTTLRYEHWSNRGEQILNWLADHQDIKNWIVLDDEIFDDYDETVMGHLVKTSWETGLTDELTDKAIEMLK